MRVAAGVQESTRAQRKKGHQRSRAGSWTTHTHTHIYSKRVNKPDRPRTQQADAGNDGNKTALRSDVFVSRRGVPVATDSTSQRATLEFCTTLPQCRMLAGTSPRCRVPAGTAGNGCSPSHAHFMFAIDFNIFARFSAQAVAGGHRRGATLGGEATLVVSNLNLNLDGATPAKGYPLL